MTRVLANNNSFNVTITPRDSAGQPINGLGAIPASRWSVSDGTNSFTVNSSTLLSNGAVTNYLLNITPSGTPTGLKTMTIGLDGLPIVTAPTPLEYDFRNGYAGRLDLTMAEMAWDCTLYDGTTSILYDAANKDNVAQRFSGGAFRNDLFTNTSQYKTSSTGGLITLGQSKISATFTELSTNLTTAFSCGLYDSGKQPAYCNEIVYANGLPVRTLIGIYYRHVGTTITEGVGCHYGWNKSGASANEGFGVAVNDGNNDKLSLFARTSSTPTAVCTIDNTLPGQLWNYANGIALIAVRINSIDSTGLASFTLNLNRAKATGTYQFGTSTQSDSTIKRGINALGSSFGASGTSTTNFLSCFDFAAYSDVKSDAFISSMCSAWGL